MENLSTFKKFSGAPLNLSNQDPSFKYQYDYILSDKFVYKRSVILVETQEFSYPRHNHGILYLSLYSHFRLGEYSES